MASNRRWRLQFRYRGSRRRSAVAQLSTLGCYGAFTTLHSSFHCDGGSSDFGCFFGILFIFDDTDNPGQKSLRYAAASASHIFFPALRLVCSCCPIELFDFRVQCFTEEEDRSCV